MNVKIPLETGRHMLLHLELMGVVVPELRSISKHMYTDIKLIKTINQSHANNIQNKFTFPEISGSI